MRAVTRDRPERGGLASTAGFVAACPCLTGRQGLQAGHRRGGTTGGDGVGTTKRGTGTTLMAGADRAGLPLAVCVTRARPHAVTVVASPLAACCAPQVPAHRIADRAADRDPLDARLGGQGIALRAPQRRNRRTARTQASRTLRRSTRRGTIARLVAWLGTFRRLVVRDARHLVTSLGFVHLGCIIMLLRHL